MTEEDEVASLDLLLYDKERKPMHQKRACLFDTRIDQMKLKPGRLIITSRYFLYWGKQTPLRPVHFHLQNSPGSSVSKFQVFQGTSNSSISP